MSTETNEKIDGVRLQIDFYAKTRENNVFKSIVVNTFHISGNEALRIICASSGIGYRMNFWEAFKDSKDTKGFFSSREPATFSPDKEGVYFKNADGKVMQKVLLSGDPIDVQENLNKALKSFLSGEMLKEFERKSAQSRLRSRASGGMNPGSVYTHSPVIGGPTSGINHS